MAGSTSHGATNEQQLGSYLGKLNECETARDLDCSVQTCMKCWQSKGVRVSNG